MTKADDVRALEKRIDADYLACFPTNAGWESAALYFLVDDAAFRAMQRQDDLAAIREGIADVKNGRVLTLEELDAAIRARMQTDRAGVRQWSLRLRSPGYVRASLFMIVASSAASTGRTIGPTDAVSPCAIGQRMSLYQSRIRL